MKLKFLALILAVSLMAGYVHGCAHIKANPEATKTVVEIAAYTLGYQGVDRYPGAFRDAATLIERMLPFVEKAPT